jgi:anaerobic ribonucleoside-triphosphate reductase
MIRVQKRDNSIVDFDLKKIENELLAIRVTADFNKKVKDGVIKVEDIQDSVEIVLIQAGYVDVARSYMDYRRTRQLRQIKKTELNYASVVDNYLKGQ